MLEFDRSAWPELTLVEPVGEGHRNLVWRGELGGRPVSVRQSRRSSASLDWELDLLAFLAGSGLVVAEPLVASGGRRHVDGVVVQRWLSGREPRTADDWRAVAAALTTIHGLTAGHDQRPGCSTIAQLATARRSVDADLDALPAEAQAMVSEVFERCADLATAVVHGDPNPANIRIGPDGQVGLLDFDESRVDVTWLDFADLGVRVLEPGEHAVAQRLAHAWEAANAWVAEPAYARRRLEALPDAK